MGLEVSSRWVYQSWCWQRLITNPFPSLSQSKQIHLFNLSSLDSFPTSEPAVTFTENKAPVYALAFSPDGELLAAGDGSGKIQVYSVADKKVRADVSRPPIFRPSLCTDTYSFLTSRSKSPTGGLPTRVVSPHCDSPKIPPCAHRVRSIATYSCGLSLSHFGRSRLR